MSYHSILGIGFAIIASVSIALQSLAVRVSTKTHSVVEVIGIMFAVNILILLPIAGVLTFPEYQLTTTALLAFAAAGVIGSLIARACYFVGIARLGASRAEPLKALLPLFAVVMAVLFLGERVTVPLAIGIALLLLGGIAVSLESHFSPTTPSGPQHWVAVAFPITAAVLLGIDPVITKIGLAEGTSALLGLSIRMIAATIGFAMYLVWRAIRTGQIIRIRANRWLLAAAAANSVYLLAFYEALARSPVTVIMPILGTSTLFVIVGAALFLQSDERVTWRLAAAAGVVVVGVVLIASG